jgi:hypothetical protein
MTLLSQVSGSNEQLSVMTKDKYLVFFNRPRTSVMPFSGSGLATRSVQFLWRTSKKAELERLHAIILESFAEGLGLDELRQIADLGKPLVAFGLPLVPEEAPIQTSLKKLGNSVKAVI